MSHAGRADRIISTLIPKTGKIKVLDIGHGYGQIALLVRSINPNAEVHGIEIYKPYHEFQKKLGLYDRLWQGNVLQIMPLLDQEYDVALASHLIEHLTKDEGNLLLDMLENLNPKITIVTTPYGLVDAVIKDGNVNNLHKSGWKPEEFKAKGYEVKLAAHQINSRAVNIFSHFWYKLRRRIWNNPVIISFKRARY